MIVLNYKTLQEQSNDLWIGTDEEIIIVRQLFMEMVHAYLTATFPPVCTENFINKIKEELGEVFCFVDHMGRPQKLKFCKLPMQDDLHSFRPYVIPIDVWDFYQALKPV